MSRQGTSTKPERLAYEAVIKLKIPVASDANQPPYNSTNDDVLEPLYPLLEKLENVAVVAHAVILVIRSARRCQLRKRYDMSRSVT